MTDEKSVALTFDLSEPKSNQWMKSLHQSVPEMFTRMGLMNNVNADVEALKATQSVRRLKSSINVKSQVVFWNLKFESSLNVNFSKVASEQLGRCGRFSRTISEPQKKISSYCLVSETWHPRFSNGAPPTSSIQPKKFEVNVLEKSQNLISESGSWHLFPATDKCICSKTSNLEMFGLGLHPCWSRRRPRTKPRSYCRECRSGWWSSPSSDSGQRRWSWSHIPLRGEKMTFHRTRSSPVPVPGKTWRTPCRWSLTWLGVGHIRRVPQPHKGKLVESPVPLVCHLHRPPLPPVHDLVLGITVCEGHTQSTNQKPC